MVATKTANNPNHHAARRHVFFWLGRLLLLAAGLSFYPLAGAQAPAVPQKAAPVTASPSVQPSYGALADLLENDQTRDQLIAQLRSLAEPKSGSQAAVDSAGRVPGDPEVATGESANEASMPQQLADKIQDFSVSLFADFSATAAAVRTLASGQSLKNPRAQKWLTELTGLAIVLAATCLAFLLFRAGAARYYTRLDNWVERERNRAGRPVAPAPKAPGGATPRKVPIAYRTVGAIVGALMIDILTILLAAAIGYAIAVFATGQSGRAGVAESLFINAFVAVEVTKALVRLVFATRYPYLRLISMPDDVAVFWNQWLAQIISVTGYGLLVAVPIVNILFLPAFGQIMGLFIMLAVYVYAVRIIWANRALLRDRLIRRAGQASTNLVGTLIRILARIWHILAIGYFTVLLVVSQIAQQEALPFMALATLQTLLAVIVGLVLTTALSTLLSRRIRLSDELRARLPMLETRINSYVPAILKATRLLILCVVTLVVFDAWHVFNLSAWIASGSGRAIIAMVVRVAIILLIAAFAWTVVASIIENRLSTAPGAGAPTEREKTLLSLFRNAALIVIVTMTILVVLSQIGINIGPLIAGAGVVGLAVAFGAQKLVQDVITGVFIQLENGMNQNDVVEVCGLFGTVEKITIRSVVIRTLDGGYHLIPFSSVDQLTNHMRGFGVHYSEYNIAHRENSDEVIDHLKSAFDEMMQDGELAPLVLEDISLPGVTSLSDRGFTVRVLIKTVPGMQWAVQRGFNRLVKKHFDAAGIELPYPQSVVHFGRDREGLAVPLTVREVSAADADGRAPQGGGANLPASQAGSG